MSTETLTQPKRNIFDIDAELDQIAMAFDQLEDGGTEEGVLAAIEAYFGDLLNERDAKLDNYVRFIAEKTAIAATRKQEAQRLSALAKTDENTAKRSKDFLKILFDSKNWQKIETKLHKFWIQNNGGAKPIVISDGIDATKVDEKYRKVTIDIDMEAVRADLAAGVEVPFAQYGEVGTYLRIK